MSHEPIARINMWGDTTMFLKSLRFLACVAVLGLASSSASAAVIERSCECQGYAKTNGAESGNNNYVEDAHKAAVYFCETGGTHPYARSAGGDFCSPPACPAGTIDTGIIVKDCRGIKKSRFNPGTATPNNFAPAEGGCNYWKADANPANWFVSCDLECTRARQCATATSN